MFRRVRPVGRNVLLIILACFLVSWRTLSQLTRVVVVLLNENSLKPLGCILKHWLCASLEWLRSSSETSVKVICFRLGLWVSCAECYSRVLRVTLQSSASLPLSGNVLWHKCTWALVTDDNLRRTHLASLAANFHYCIVCSMHNLRRSITRIRPQFWFDVGINERYGQM
jgi:hypothetical protein